MLSRRGSRIAGPVSVFLSVESQIATPGVDFFSAEVGFPSAGVRFVRPGKLLFHSPDVADLSTWQ